LHVIVSTEKLGLAAGALSAAAAEVGPNQATSHQLACLGRRPTETLSEQAVAVPIAAVAAHQEPPLLPPQRPEHKVGFAPFLVGQHCYHYTSTGMKHAIGLGPAACLTASRHRLKWVDTLDFLRCL